MNIIGAITGVLIIIYVVVKRSAARKKSELDSRFGRKWRE